MLRTDKAIQTIPSMSQAIANPATGDLLVVDIDDTLLLTGHDKYQATPKLTENELAGEIKRLRERGIKVIGLTARKTKYAEATFQQLKKSNITLDEIIHAPSIKSGDGRTVLQKGPILKAWLQRQPAQPRRVFVFDNDKNQLLNILQSLQDTTTSLHLKHYSALQYQPIQIHNSDRHQFPVSLDQFHLHSALGGGTNSVFSLQHETTGKRYVLKSGAHEDAGKIEMLCNAVYRALGVNVPSMRVYQALPQSLADELKLKNRYGMFQVGEFVESCSNNSEHIIKSVARHNFVAHVLLGNIDVAKIDNFIVDADGVPYLIDAGANFLFRAKGEARKEDATLASEIDTLRNQEINAKAHAWFASLTEGEISAQVTALLARRDDIENAVWDASNQLDLPENLRDRFLECLSDRLDTLVTRFCRGSQLHAKTDKKAHAATTSAGVLTYTFIDGKPYVLLSKRVRHEWWDNFGGKSETGDQYLVTTARREVAEESQYQLNYTDHELANSPFHDLVTGTGSQQKLYRMYISPYRQINARQLQDNEHTEHQWVSLQALLHALQYGKKIKMEGCETIVVEIGQQHIALFPPLLQMLQQPAVRANLESLLQTGKLKCLHTLSHAAIQKPPNLQYLPLATPASKRQSIAATLKHKSRMLREIKSKRPLRDLEPKSVMREPVANFSGIMTQSEFHLKAILGAAYQVGNLEANIRRFVKKNYGSHPQLQSIEQRERLIRAGVELIENERRGHRDQFYFYHVVITRLHSPTTFTRQFIRHCMPMMRLQHFVRTMNISSASSA